ncbi:MAG: tetratricopeptide repeat protein [Burkholderiales bacterium]|nr:tetratricopeptide repeat protein [Burkholderiales bacterium]
MPPERNAPCPCGSGKKYKHCCAEKAAPRALAPTDFNQLIALFNAGRYAELENRARSLLEQYPDAGFCWKALGLSLQMQGKNALGALQKAAQFLPNDAETHNNLGHTLQVFGLHAEAAASFRRALALAPHFVEAHANLGNALKDLGQLDAAVASYRKALEINPHVAEIHSNLGAILHELQQFDEAAASHRRALELNPQYAAAHNNLGNVLRDKGQLDEAVACYQQALELDPHYADAHNNLGTVLQARGESEAAVESYRHAIENNPDYAEAYSNLATALQGLGRFEDAMISCRKALEIKPDFVDAQYNLGIALRALGRLDAAVASYRRALEIQPDYADAHNNLGTALQALGQFDGAMACYRRALEIKPDFAEAYNNLGLALKGLGELEGAVACCRKALEVKHDYVDAHNSLGMALQDLGQLDAALASYRQALAINPYDAYAHNNLGNALKDLGQIHDAVASYRQALAIKPDFTMAYSNLLFALNFTDTHATSNCLDAAHEYGRIVSKRAVERFSAWRCETKPERLRVGLVSGDLRNHPVGYALESLLVQLDPARIELIAYPTTSKADELTVRIRPHFAAWKPLFGQSDEAAARLIHADGVHVLLDISGHTAHNRLPMFAWKPAPIQASWLGYFATTGVAEMDFLLTSEVAVPKAHQEHFTESVWYLPDIWLCFTPPEFDLTVAALPAFENGHLTFGCFQRMDKMGEGVLKAWGRILSALPNARLLFANKQLGDPGVAAQFLQRLQQHGIDPERVATRGAAESRAEYLGRYAEVDVMLDTFPYPGVTTTCEALWMGVPTLTLGGDTLLARQGAGVVTPAGLGEWAATSEAGYVEKAISLTNDLSKLANLRAGQRARVLASPVYDAPRFARNFEAALWGMWRKWNGRE